MIALFLVSELVTRGRGWQAGVDVGMVRPGQDVAAPGGVPGEAALLRDLVPSPGLTAGPGLALRLARREVTPGHVQVLRQHIVTWSVMLRCRITHLQPVPAALAKCEV